MPKIIAELEKHGALDRLRKWLEDHPAQSSLTLAARETFLSVTNTKAALRYLGYTISKDNSYRWSDRNDR